MALAGTVLVVAVFLAALFVALLLAIFQLLNFFLYLADGAGVVLEFAVDDELPAFLAPLVLLKTLGGTRDGLQRRVDGDAALGSLPGGEREHGLIPAVSSYR